MPVYLEHVQQASEQDLIDLQKLYADYPVDFSFDALQQHLQATPGTRLFAGRFNDRLLGAVALTEDGDTALLDHLCVRKLTRQRTVGRELLRNLMAQHPYKQFQFTSCIDDAGVDGLFAHFGFNKSLDGDKPTYTLTAD